MCGDRCARDSMVVRHTTTYAIRAFNNDVRFILDQHM